MEKVIVKASNKTKGKKKFDLYIGRWQPWHQGHQWLINQSLDKGKNVCIAIRNVDVDAKNPWTAYEIYESLLTRFSKEIEHGCIAIIIIPDIDSINIGRDVGYDIIEHVPSDEIAQISATKIREQQKKDSKIPTSVYQQITKRDTFKIRYNTACKSDKDCWRIIDSFDNEFLVKSVDIRNQCRSTKDWIAEIQEFKYHLSTRGVLYINGENNAIIEH